MCTGAGDGGGKLTFTWRLATVHSLWLKSLLLFFFALPCSKSDTKSSEAEGFAVPAASRSVAALSIEKGRGRIHWVLELGLKNRVKVH